ncbi:hypothetical protein B0H16DRAFT_1570925 [Mycena metata]|uniref:Uncharacterized protein n=1 Tax=Mycena metata TaxID=1033252 RepID=A0AAD7I9P2_9AGAR|nr:hypothetical protein B0H16DRAFT_1570925 [Mycena metata]
MSWLIKRALEFLSGETSTPEPSASADVLAARDALMCLLPLELVYIVLNLAEYWVPDTSVCSVFRAVSASGSPDNNASLCYLVTASIWDSQPDEDEDGEGVRLKLVCVQFKLLSHDQGWAGEVHLQSTYGGHTWFEAAILRPDRSANPTLRSWLAGALRGPTRMEPSGGYDPALEVPTGSDSDDGAENTRWELQRNFCASRHPYSHTVTWTAEGSTTGTAHGAGDGMGFVERLRAGDRIAVVARAQYPQWCNKVEQVEVTVHYALA